MISDSSVPSRATRWSITALLLAFLTIGCTGLTDPNPTCTMEPKNAVEVKFFDSATGDTLKGITPGAIHDGDFIDSLSAAGFDSDRNVVTMGAGMRRPGTYMLTADRDGYRPYSMSGIKVRSYTCGVATVYVEAELQPVPRQ